MKNRHRLSKKGSRKLFSRTAQRVHKKNFSGGVSVMRGGIRL